MNEAVRQRKPPKLIRGATGDWEVVIGMEVHAQVASNAKLFSGASTAFGGAPNDHVSLVDAAMPGMLPVINRECVAQAVRTGLGLKAAINLRSVFDRKNYFYPDLPQGYQISQYKQPVVGEGVVEVDLPDGETVRIGIERLHLEQDAGKSIHDQSPTMSLVDLNRSGVALMEIVSRPDIRSSEEARMFLTKLRTILRYLGTCDGDMEKGSLRADVNVSVRRPGEPLGTRCEIKNVNSIRFVGQAVDYEARRQIEIIEEGGTIDQETRLFDANNGETRSMRSKEEAHDYRYFPDPDLLPLEFTRGWVDGLAAALPELPDARKARFITGLGRTAYQAAILTAEKARADYYELMIAEGADRDEAANWIINEYLGRAESEQQPSEPIVKAQGPTGPTGPVYSHTHSMTRSTSLVWGPTGPAANATIVKMISSGEISRRQGKELLDATIEDGPTNDPAVVRSIAEARGLRQESDTGAIEEIVAGIVAANPDKAAQAKEKPAMLGWFVGQAMKASGGKANPQAVNAALKAKLGIE